MSVEPTGENKKDTIESDKWRSLLDSLFDLTYSQACESILQFVSRHYSISSLAWLERKGDYFETVYASGKLEAEQTRFSIAADDERLIDAAKREISFEMRELHSAEKSDSPRISRFFPIAVGRQVRSALLIADEIFSENKKRHLSLFCQVIASELEILRLREELNKRYALESAVQKFNQNVKDTDKDIDTNDFWLSLINICAELLNVERASLLMFDEQSNSFSAKAATISPVEFDKKDAENLGKKIAHRVLQNGKPLVVTDVRQTELPAAPVEYSYKSKSFIIYPIVVHGRKIGVLNLTDRADDKHFSELDLEILNAVMPQLAVLTDTALLKGKVSEFKRLSITDALTGLLNRLYLDERLPEEIRRSNREGFPMSFLMIDVDDFKAYNDSFGHTEGDNALKLVAHCLKETLRGADVAVRYGGEEFSILLPQTSSDEAAKIGERLREKVTQTEFPNRQITISVGVASCQNANCTAEQIIKWADEALYEAKRQGKNNMQIYRNL